MSRAPHLCYYSARCPFSQMFLEQLSKTPWAAEFRFVCVDAPPGGARPALPAWLKAVPTLVIAGEPEPRRDAAVMNWISERRMREGGGASAGAGKPRSIRDGGGPMALTTAMGVVSSEGLDAMADCATADEGFCFIGEDTSVGKGAMVRLSGTMVGIDDMAGMPGAAAGVKPVTVAQMAGSTTGSAPGASMSVKARMLDDRMAAFQAERNRDFGPPRR